MSAKSQSIQNAAAALANAGLKLNASLQQEIQSLSEPKYRVAVVGRYQVGKSTLINNVFLGDDPLLVTGKGLCTTAVVTEVCYGEASRMTIHEWECADDDEKRKMSIADNRDKVSRIIEKPTIDNVREATVSEDVNARVSLARRLSRVTLEAPISQLRQYTLLDTPGIDDPAPELLENTTYRIIPGADLAIVVVECRQLDQRELGLIRKDLIGDGVSRLMVLVSYRPEDDSSEEKRKMILNTIKAQLANIGREEIPVQMYCFDETVKDIYNSALQIRLLITSFLAQNALAGREERIASHLHREVETMLLQNAARMKAGCLTDEEKRKLEQRISRAVDDFRVKAQRLFAEMDLDIAFLKKRVSQRIDGMLANVFDECRQSMRSQKTLDELQSRVKTCEATLKKRLNDEMVLLQAEIRRMVKEVLEKYHGGLVQLYSDWGIALDKELNVGNTFLTRIPSVALEILNVILLDFLLPGGWIIAAVGRIFAGKCKKLADFLLQNLGKKLLEDTVCSQLDAAQIQVSSDLSRQVTENIAKVFEKLHSDVESENGRQVEAIRSAMNESPEKSQEKAGLEARQAVLQEVLKTL